MRKDNVTHITTADMLVATYQASETVRNDDPVKHGELYETFLKTCADIIGYNSDIAPLDFAIIIFAYVKNHTMTYRDEDISLTVVNDDWDNEELIFILKTVLNIKVIDK